MSFIPCDECCVYQSDGYCMLDTPAVVTDQACSQCVHFIEKKAAEGTLPQPGKIKYN